MLADDYDNMAQLVAELPIIPMSDDEAIFSLLSSERIDKQHKEKETHIVETLLPCQSSLHHRSLSEDSTARESSRSPNSVLHSSKHETIMSDNPIFNTTKAYVKKKPFQRGRKKGSKSLTELEFEELKGFMDLGFTFSTEEIDSRLISIIPELQRLGKKTGGDCTVDDNPEEPVVSRPYLSEVWGTEEKRRNPLSNWKIPDVKEGIDMRDHLRVWALTVASAVR